jgi:hypothetical protein
MLLFLALMGGIQMEEAGEERERKRERESGKAGKQDIIYNV